MCRGAESASIWDDSGQEKGKKGKLLKTVLLSCHLIKSGKIFHLFENTFITWTLDQHPLRLNQRGYGACNQQGGGGGLYFNLGEKD